MKILFICGCIEPGKDGVGDYTRRLCGELLGQGVEVGIIAYNDGFVKGVIENSQQEESVLVPCLRLPESLTNKDRVNICKSWISLKNPVWLSLQFVPYSFNAKGLPFNLGKQLKIIGGNRNWHIMFHELWIGMNKESIKKDNLIGFLQKYSIKQLIFKLKPRAINTQTELYKKQLEKLGFEASILPIFSNIPVLKGSIGEKYNTIHFDIPDKYFVLFGSIHHGVPIKEFVKEFMKYLKDDTYALVTIGNNGKELDGWKQIWESFGIKVICMGKQSVEVISYVLQNATFGISTTPLELVEKSGSVAAMREHNVPVICISRPWTPNGLKDDLVKDGVLKYNIGEISTCFKIKNTTKSTENNLKKIALLFLENLNLN